MDGRGLSLWVIVFVICRLGLGHEVPGLVDDFGSGLRVGFAAEVTPISGSGSHTCAPSATSVASTRFHLALARLGFCSAGEKTQGARDWALLRPASAVQNEARHLYRVSPAPQTIPSSGVAATGAGTCTCIGTCVALVLHCVLLVFMLYVYSLLVLLPAAPWSCTRGMPHPRLIEGNA